MENKVSLPRILKAVVDVLEEGRGGGKMTIVGETPEPERRC